MKQFYSILLVLLIVGGFGPFLLLSSSAFPAIDDFPCSLAARDAGLITSIVTWYKIWTARYFSVFMWWLCPLVRGWDSGYQFTATFVFAGHTVSTTGFLYLVRKWLSFSSGQIWLFGGVFSLGYLSVVPSVPECLYYYNGLVCYQPASMFILISFAFLIRFWGRPVFGTRQSMVELGLASTLIFCIIGSNESSMLAITLIISGFWAYFILMNRSVSLCYSLLLLEVVVLDSLVVFSPATQLRMGASGSETRSLFFVFHESCLFGISFFFKQLSNPFFYLMSICFFRMVPQNRVELKNAIAICALLFGVYFLSHLPSFLGEGVVQGRTANAVAYLFLMAWLVFLFYLKQSVGFQNQHSRFILIGLATVFLFSLFASPKFQNPIFDAYSDLISGEAEMHRKEVLARFRYLQSTDSDSVKVLPYRYFPSSTFVADIVPNGGNTSYNAFYARYYGKKHIELKSE